jgi:hypothetical protein
MACSSNRSFILSATAALILGCIALTAHAGWLAEPEGDYVVAHSKFGNGTVVGPVRRTRVGWQVKTPGGSWLDCARSCSETLRVNTVDFWQNAQGAGERGAIDQEDGLLSRWLHWDW